MRKILVIAMAAVGAGLFAFVALAVSVYLNLQEVTAIKGCLTTTMFQVSLCPGSSGYVRINQISDLMIQAVIVTEDASFFSHEGFDWDEIRKSLETNMNKGGFARGGSTITQQLAKNVFLTQEKTITRKLKEAFLAYRIEETLTKKEILERYLNVVEFGPGVYGIKAAARHYFLKSPSQLNVLEASYLTHLLPNPKVYSRTLQKGKLTDFSRKRVLAIVQTLASYGRIKASQKVAARTLVDRFPWRSLEARELAWLKGDLEDYEPDVAPEVGDQAEEDEASYPEDDETFDPDPPRSRAINEPPAAESNAAPEVEERFARDPDSPFDE